AVGAPTSARNSEPSSLQAPDLQQQLEELRREVDAARAREDAALAEAAASRELLQVLGRATTDADVDLDAVAECVARACSADDAVISRINGSTLRPFAHSRACADFPTGLRIPLRRTMPMTRAAAERRTIHVPDLDALSEAEY